jgi:hypothetical protein
MFDVSAWLWFFVRTLFYGAVIIGVCSACLCAAMIGYYWFVVRQRLQDDKQRKKQLEQRAFVFHTLFIDVSTTGQIDVRVQRSQIDKQVIDLAQLNVRQYPIRSIDIHNDQVQIIFAQSDVQLTIEHQEIEQISVPSQLTYFVHEYSFQWSSNDMRLYFHDRIHLKETGYWYGGATQRSVYWPINQFVTKRQAMVPQDAYKLETHDARKLIANDLFSGTCSAMCVNDIGSLRWALPFMSILWFPYSLPWIRNRWNGSPNIERRIVKRNRYRIDFNTNCYSMSTCVIFI